MKRLAQILIIALLLLGATGVYAISITGTQIGPRELHLGKPLGLGGVPEEGWVDDPRQPSYYKYSNETLNSVLSAPGTLSTADRGVILAELQLRSDLATGIVPPHTSAETMRVDQYEEAFNNTLYNRTGNHFQPNGQMVNQAGVPINNSVPVDSAGNAKSEAFPNCGLDPFCGLVKFMAWILQKGVVTLFAWLGVVANQIFNISIDISVRDFASIANSDGINVAWRVMRNLVNITFIFVLLYVAIGTILRLDSVNGKKLLSKIIIAALLVNFSAFFTRIMIDASNVVANQLYSAAGPSTNGGAPDVIGQLTQAADLGYKKTLANEAEKAVWANSSSVTGTADKYTILLQIIVAAIGTIILMLISTTVLLAGALMFLTRAIVLIFIIVLSPLAFLGFAVGGTLGKLASDWRNKLVNQLIFAPVYILLIYLTVQIVIKSNQITDINNSFAGGLSVFALINGLMISSLIAAKSLGVAGAGMADKYGSKPSKWLGGLAAGAAGYYPQRLGQYAQRQFGRTAENLQQSQGRVARFARSVPLVNRLTGQIAGQARKAAGETQRRIEGLNLSDAALKNRLAMSSLTTSAAEKIAITNILAARNNLGPARGASVAEQERHAEQIQTVVRRQEGIGASVKPIQEQAWQFATEPVQQAAAIQGSRGVPGRADIPVISPQAVARLNAGQYFAPPPGAVGHVAAAHAANQQVRNAMYSVFNGGHIQNLTERADNAADTFFENLATDLAAVGATRTIASVIDRAEMPRAAGGWGNPRLAAWARSPAGENILRSYHFT